MRYELTDYEWSAHFGQICGFVLVPSQFSADVL
jgi:hypothetical protein